MAYLPHIVLFSLTASFGLLAYFFQRELTGSVKLFLSFSGAFLLATCVIHLLPEIFEHQDQNVALFILLGFFLQIIIEYISQGVEHGHIHKPHHKSSFPILIFTGLCFHAFTEGLPIAGITSVDLRNNPLYWGIMLHKIPIVVVLVTLLVTYKVNRYLLIGSLIFFSALAPAGGLLGEYIDANYAENLLPFFLAISTGIFLHISTVILFETSHNHRFNFMKFLFILFGGLLAVLLF